MKSAQIIVPHDRRAHHVSIDGAAAKRMNVLTPPGFGFDIETWETVEEGPWPAGPKPEIVEVSYRDR